MVAPPWHDTPASAEGELLGLAGAAVGDAGLGLALAGVGLALAEAVDPA